MLIPVLLSGYLPSPTASYSGQIEDMDAGKTNPMQDIGWKAVKPRKNVQKLGCREFVSL